MNAHVYTLRLSHVSVSASQYQVEVALEKDGQPLHKAVSPLFFTLSSQDQEDLRWYLEDYLQYPLDPAPTVAKRVEGQMAAIGQELFRGIFQQNDDARKLWAAALPHLNNTRVEIVAEADAKEYALAALRNFETYGANAAKDVQDTLELLADIEKAIKLQSGEKNE